MRKNRKYQGWEKYHGPLPISYYYPYSSGTYIMDKIPNYMNLPKISNQDISDARNIWNYDYEYQGYYDFYGDFDYKENGHWYSVKYDIINGLVNWDEEIGKALKRDKLIDSILDENYENKIITIGDCMSKK